MGIYSAELTKARPARHRLRTGIYGTVASMLCFFGLITSSQATEIFHVGFTHQAFSGVNENDAMAATRAWAQAFVAERKIPAAPETIIFNNLAEVEAALSSGTIESLMMTTSEFFQMRNLVADDVMLFGVVSGSITEEYMLLVNRKNNIKKLNDLKGRTLGMLSSVRASLAEIWLDTLLLREGLEPAPGFFGRVDTDPKVGNLLLSLFFGKLDACVVTRKGFDIMVELNPQTGKQLEALEISPLLIPTVFCFRKDYTSPLRNQILGEIQRWHLSPAGKQSLTIFQTDSLEQQPVSCLDSVLELLAEHQRLLDETGSGLAENRQGTPRGGALGENRTELRNE